ncbi:MAG: Beta-ketoacyl-acyl-carrier-protein synthase [Proteobacteria bacterium]|nr:Beta-ketoacyl-acyl-carrier-protein synthase [Pseudomonadota bacterium]
MTPCFLGRPGLVSALGEGVEATRAALFAGDTSGMVLEDGLLPAAPARVGRVRAALPEIPASFGVAAQSRNNRLLLAAIAQIADQIEAAKARFGADRVGIVLGTSTSGVAEGEAAIAAFHRDGCVPAGFDYGQMEIGAPAPFLARYLGLLGPAYTVSTACTSGAKALASARNLLRLGLVDAVIAGGVDTLCRLTINGFAALESTTADLTNPLSANRHGINIGEAAAVFLVTRDEGEVQLLGIGESSDAHHMSAPEPEGRGAELALRAALSDAGLTPKDITYINLHATATPKNDEMESRVVSRVFPDGVPVSGTKPMTGHTLGAAGALEAAFCWLALTGDGRLPPHVWDGAADPALPPLSTVLADQRFADQARVVMSNSFAFGGNNISLILRENR